MFGVGKRDRKKRKETMNTEETNVVETVEEVVFSNFESCIVRDENKKIDVNKTLVNVKTFLGSLLEQEEKDSVEFLELAREAFASNRAQPVRVDVLIFQMAQVAKISAEGWIPFEKKALSFLQSCSEFTIAKGRSVGGVWQTHIYDQYKLELEAKKNKKGNNK